MLMKNLLSATFFVSMFAALPSTSDAWEGDCKLSKVAELPVTMVESQPLISAKINGVEVRLVADTGAFFSTLTPGSAAELKLVLRPTPSDIYVSGVGGDADVSLTTVKLTLANHDLPRVDFLVGGSGVGLTNAGLLGNNMLGYFDAEYDLANGMINLVKEQNCYGVALVYWDKTKPYSVVKLESDRPLDQLPPPPIAIAHLNGVPIRVAFDTGAESSLLSLDAAARAGVRPGSANVVSAGYTSGIGRKTVQTWIAPFDSFKIGDEEIKHARLRIGDIGFDHADMLLGADFFLSHHVYIANSQYKAFFTYNGGAVFNLSVKSSSGQQAEAAARLPAVDNGSEPKDSDGYSRRGQARLSRGDVAGALSDLDEAIKLAPSEARYFQERGMLQAANERPVLAMADFNQALKLKPDFVAALMARGELHLTVGEVSDALADFDAVDRLLSRESDLRLALGHLYSRLNQQDRAVVQFDFWIKAHPDDSRQPQALNGRCWARAQLGQDLPKALSDCNASLRQTKSAETYDSRGLVELRLGAYDKAITDYDAALALQPKTAWSLYGRGVARIRTGHAAEGQADIAAAAAIRPELPAEAKAIGLTP